MLYCSRTSTTTDTFRKSLDFVIPFPPCMTEWTRNRMRTPAVLFVPKSTRRILQSRCQLGLSRVRPSVALWALQSALACCKTGVALELPVTFLETCDDRVAYLATNPPSTCIFLKREKYSPGRVSYGELGAFGKIEAKKPPGG